MCGLMFSIKFGKFGLLFLQFFAPFFPSPSRIPIMSMLICFVVQKVSEALLIPFFFLYVSVDLIFEFTDLSAISNLLLSPPREFFISIKSVLYFSTPKLKFFCLFIDSLYFMKQSHTYFSSLDMASFICLNIFIIAYLKSLSSKSNVWVQGQFLLTPFSYLCLGHTFLFLWVSHDFC